MNVSSRVIVNPEGRSCASGSAGRSSSATAAPGQRRAIPSLLEPVPVCVDEHIGTRPWRNGVRTVCGPVMPESIPVRCRVPSVVSGSGPADLRAQPLRTCSTRTKGNRWLRSRSRESGRSIPTGTRRFMTSRLR